MTDEKGKRKAELVIEKLEEKDCETSDFRIYDCPTEVKNEYISMAKLYYDNDVWKVMAEAINLLKKEKEGDFDGKLDDLNKRLSELEEEVEIMKKLDAYSEGFDIDKGNDEKKTFGGMPEKEEKEDASEDIEALKNIKGEN